MVGDSGLGRAGRRGSIDLARSRRARKMRRGTKVEELKTGTRRKKRGKGKRKKQGEEEMERKNRTRDEKCERIKCM